ncbi:MAG: sugar:cation symporter [Marinicaulis sp.]|nr:sugar:cation symporter [Marinicaulis sp.]
MSDAAIGRGTFARYALFGSAIAFAGPPIYIHAPKFYADIHGMDIAVIGATLLAVRAIDFVQDPLIGTLVEKFSQARRTIAIFFALALGTGVSLLFAASTPFSPQAQLIIASIIVFTGFSGLQILFYSTGVGIGRANYGNHAQVSAWRETGILAGVCAASAAPSLIGGDLASSYGTYAMLFVAYLAIAVILMRNVWPLGGSFPQDGRGFLYLFRDGQLRKIFAIGLLNTLPIGVTSTLFLFYVSDRLAAPDMAGVLLLVFFLSAGLAAPLWARAASRFGMRRSLMAGMALSILIFALAIPLGVGDGVKFAIISAASGAALSADLTLMPAILSSRLQAIDAGAGKAFGVWGFLTKASLAIAAGVVLPMLAFAGYAPGEGNSQDALFALSLGYAGFPCLLKVFALGALYLARNIDAVPVATHAQSPTG